MHVLWNHESVRYKHLHSKLNLKSFFLNPYLQVLLSQVHRPRALELLGSFLALGPWAVNLVLSVGIFPYVLRLLQSSARELRPLLVFLWAKILAVDPVCFNLYPIIFMI